MFLLFLIYVFTNYDSNSHEKCVYNFASLVMESTEEPPVESIKPEVLEVPPSQSHKKLTRRKEGWFHQTGGSCYLLRLSEC
jgi:hypothetical protein